MKAGDIVRHRIDGDIGLILSIDGISLETSTGEVMADLYEILWATDGYTELSCYGEDGSNLEVINESR